MSCEKVLAFLRENRYNIYTNFLFKEIMPCLL